MIQTIVCAELHPRLYVSPRRAEPWTGSAGWNRRRALDDSHGGRWMNLALWLWIRRRSLTEYPPGIRPSTLGACGCGERGEPHLSRKELAERR
jgi:hypothetical protein